MKNILFLNYEYPPLGAGAGNATYNLLKEFAKNKNLRISVVTSSVNKYYDEKISDNIKIYHLNVGKYNKNLNKQSIYNLSLYTVKSYFYCRRLLKKENFDFVHAFFGVPCGFVALLLNRPYLVSLRGSDVPGYNNKYNILYFFLQKIIIKVWQKAKIIIANSNDLKKLALNFYSSADIEVIKNGVDIDFFYPAPKTNKIFTVIYAGRLAKVKRVKDLVRAFNIFSKNKDDVRLIIAGSGSQKKKLTSVKNNKTEILSFQPSDKLARLYQSADVFVQSSINEGMSNSLLEAMASGLAVIATDTGGVSEFINNDNLIIKKERPMDIVRALNYLYRNQDILKRIKFNNRQLAIGLSWSNSADEYIKFYNRV